MKKRIIRGLMGILTMGSLVLPKISVQAAGYSEVGEFGRPFVLVYEYEATPDTPEQIAEEIRLGDMELIAQLVEAEAGNQSFEGKCRVVDVILNRIESPDFPDNAFDVIFQKGQFSVTWNGAFEKAGYNMKEDDYRAVEYEMQLHENKDILYFNCNTIVGGKGKPFKVGGHWFNT